jgi:penicillin-insensitive murein DD-endopeptidase
MSVLRPHTLAVILIAFVPALASAAPNGKPAPKPAAQASPAKPVVQRTAHHGSTAKINPPAHRTQPGRSIGSPTDGHLEGGARLADAPYLRIVPSYAAGDNRWGLEPLVGLIDRAAKTVRKQYPDAVLSVGHLSRKGGGDLERHASHESGRDADIGFYVKNHVGKPIYADHFVAFKGDGTAGSWPGAHFDDARNWALVAALVGDGRAHITHIFVTTELRQRLLEYAARIGAPPNLRSRAAEVMAQPKGALPHDDHFHVRIGCPSGMQQCVEQPVARHHHKGKHPQPQAHARAHGHPGAHGKPAPHSPAAKPRPPAPPSSKSDDGDDDHESQKSGSLIPSLAPIVPGLDSAVIPSPLKPSIAPAAPTKPPAPAIDDPDGVLEQP